MIIITLSYTYLDTFVTFSLIQQYLLNAFQVSTLCHESVMQDIFNEFRENKVFKRLF